MIDDIQYLINKIEAVEKKLIERIEKLEGKNLETDVVAVTRCRYCHNWIAKDNLCAAWGSYASGPDGFCNKAIKVM